MNQYQACLYSTECIYHRGSKYGHENSRMLTFLTNFAKNVKIGEFHGHIWNHHEKCIHLSTNMPGIGSLIREIDIKFQKFEK